jgi:hypothetical protein
MQITNTIESAVRIAESMPEPEFSFPFSDGSPVVVESDGTFIVLEPAEENEDAIAAGFPRNTIRIVGKAVGGKFATIRNPVESDV